MLMPTGSLPGSCALHQFLAICVPFDALGVYFPPFPELQADICSLGSEVAIFIILGEGVLP